MKNILIIILIVVAIFICVSWSFNLQDCIWSKFMDIGAEITCKF